MITLYQLVIYTYRFISINNVDPINSPSRPAQLPHWLSWLNQRPGSLTCNYTIWAKTDAPFLSLLSFSSRLRHYSDLVVYGNSNLQPELFSIHSSRDYETGIIEKNLSGDVLHLKLVFINLYQSVSHCWLFRIAPMILSHNLPLNPLSLIELLTFTSTNSRKSCELPSFLLGSLHFLTCWQLFMEQIIPIIVYRNLGRSLDISSNNEYKQQL